MSLAPLTPMHSCGRRDFLALSAKPGGTVVDAYVYGCTSDIVELRLAKRLHELATEGGIDVPTIFIRGLLRGWRSVADRTGRPQALSFVCRDGALFYHHEPEAACACLVVNYRRDIDSEPCQLILPWPVPGLAEAVRNLQRACGNLGDPSGRVDVRDKNGHLQMKLTAAQIDQISGWKPSIWRTPIPGVVGRVLHDHRAAAAGR